MLDRRSRSFRRDSCVGTTHDETIWDPCPPPTPSFLSLFSGAEPFRPRARPARIVIERPGLDIGEAQVITRAEAEA